MRDLTQSIIRFLMVCLTVMVSVVVAVWVIGGVSGSQVAHAQVRMAQMKSGGGFSDTPK